MRVTHIRVGRSYNTMGYTSQRFELEVELEEDEDADSAILTAANQLDNLARGVMRLNGIRQIQEPTGVVSLWSRSGDAEGDVDDIPF